MLIACLKSFKCFLFALSYKMQNPASCILSYLSSLISTSVPSPFVLNPVATLASFLLLQNVNIFFFFCLKWLFQCSLFGILFSISQQCWYLLIFQVLALQMTIFQVPNNSTLPNLKLGCLLIYLSIILSSLECKLCGSRRTLPVLFLAISSYCLAHIKYSIKF